MIMKKLVCLFLISFSVNSHAGFLDSFLNSAAQSAFNQKVSELYKKALACNPRETDYMTGKTIVEFMPKKPTIPYYTMLSKLESVANAANTYAKAQSGSDKVKHCFAGCYVRQKLDKNSGVMTGWLKELQDASDCSLSTHFEEGDYYATAAGAIAAGYTTCENFCHRSDILNATGEEMLYKANNR
jgi:hypothetical protein